MSKAERTIRREEKKLREKQIERIKEEIDLLEDGIKVKDIKGHIISYRQAMPDYEKKIKIRETLEEDVLRILDRYEKYPHLFFLWALMDINQKIINKEKLYEKAIYHWDDRFREYINNLKFPLRSDLELYQDVDGTITKYIDTKEGKVPLNFFYNPPEYVPEENRLGLVDIGIREEVFKPEAAEIVPAYRRLEERYLDVRGGINYQAIDSADSEMQKLIIESFGLSREGAEKNFYWVSFKTLLENLKYPEKSPLREDFLYLSGIEKILGVKEFNFTSASEEVLLKLLLEPAGQLLDAKFFVKGSRYEFGRHGKVLRVWINHAIHKLQGFPLTRKIRSSIIGLMETLEENEGAEWIGGMLGRFAKFVKRPLARLRNVFGSWSTRPAVVLTRNTYLVTDDVGDLSAAQELSAVVLTVGPKLANVLTSKEFRDLRKRIELMKVPVYHVDDLSRVIILLDLGDKETLAALYYTEPSGTVHLAKSYRELRSYLERGKINEFELKLVQEMREMREKYPYINRTRAYELLRVERNNLLAYKRGKRSAKTLGYWICQSPFYYYSSGDIKFLEEICPAKPLSSVRVPSYSSRLVGPEDWPSADTLSINKLFKECEESMLDTERRDEIVEKILRRIRMNPKTLYEILKSREFVRELEIPYSRDIRY